MGNPPSHTLWHPRQKPQWHLGTWTPIGGMAIQSNVTPTPVSQDLRAALSLLWHRIQRQGPAPPWAVESFPKPLLPHETTLTYHLPISTQTSPLEKTLLDLHLREASRYTTTAITASQEHLCPCVEQLFNAQLLPHTALQKPMPAEAEAIMALPLRLRKLVMTKILHRFATVGPNTPLLIDCPGLGGDSLGLSPPPDLTICCLAVGNTQVYGPTLTPVDKVDPNGHIVSYGNTSGIHEMTVALLGIEQNAMRWEKLGLGTASDILHRTLLVLRHAQRLPAHRRPPHAIFLGACAIKLSLYHPCSQRHWLHLMHDAFVTPLTENRPIRLRGFSAGNYTAATVALLLAHQITSWTIQLSLGAYAGPATILTALCAKAATSQVTTSIVHLQADQLCLWGATDISCFQIPPRFRVCYLTGQPQWMHAPFHDYAHLLEVQLPSGVHEVTQLVLTIADLIPYKRRLGTPLRLITWMRMRTTHLEDSSRHIVNALRAPNPIQYLLQGYNVTTDEQAKAILFSHFDLTPCDTQDSIPRELCQWLKQLVQQHLQDLPLLELSTLISLFLPQIPRESLRTRNLRSLHPPPNSLVLTRLHDGLGGMDQYQLTLAGWPPPLIFVPSNTDLPWQDWLDESTNFKQIQFGVTIGDILCLCIEPHLFQDSATDPWGMGTTALPPHSRLLVFAAIVTATHAKPVKSRPHHTEADKAILRANYRHIEFAIIPAPQGLVHLPPPHHLPHTQQSLEWADTSVLKAIPACRLIYVSHRGTTWNCSHLVQLAETHKHHKPLSLGIPVQAPFTPTPSTHHDAIVAALRNLVDILMLNRPSICPALAPLAQHICETAATDSGHFVAVLSSVYLSLLSGRKALNIQGVFGAGKTRSVTLLMVWITFATDAKIIFLSKENPAGRAVEDLMAGFSKFVPDLKSKLSRVTSAQESERYKNQQRPLVLDTKGSVPQIGNVGQALVATTGLVWSSKGNYRSRALQQTQEADIVVVEEAQQTPDVKTTLSLSHAHPSSLLLLVGDEQQAPGGIEDDPDLKLLRGPLLNAPIGLRALSSEQYRSPHAIPLIIHQLLATLGPLDPAFTVQHLDNVCHPLAPLVIHSARTAPATTGRAASTPSPAAAYFTNLLSDTLPLHLQDTQSAPPPIAIHSPTGTTIALLHLLGQADAGIHIRQAATAMEAAGLAGVHKWGVILPTSARVVKSIYEPAIATIYPSLCEVHNRQWKIGTPRQAIPTNLPTGPRFIRLHPNLFENRPVAVEEIRQVFRLITQGMNKFQIGTTAQTGLLVMTNRTEVKAALDTRPPTATTQHIQIENVVTVAGATARHGLILHFNIGFLSGNSQNMTEDDVTESYLRANVGYTRATNSLLMASPIDMAGLPGVFQTLAVLLTGVTTIYRTYSYYHFAKEDEIDDREISDEEWERMTTGAILGSLPLPLALVQVSARRRRNEIAQQHARVRGTAMPADKLTNIRLARLRLVLLESHRVHPSVWTPESKQVNRHPTWPGGHYKHELVWAYAEDGTTRPTWIVLPHPHRPDQYVLYNNFTASRYGTQQGEQFTLLMPLPKIFYFDAHRRYPIPALSTPGSLLSYAIPNENDRTFLPQLLEQLPEATLTPPQAPQPDEQGEPLPPRAALAPAKLEEVPEDVRKNWHTALTSFLQEPQGHNSSQTVEINPRLMAALPCYWPLVRMSLCGQAAMNRFRVSLRRVYYNAKLLGADDNQALDAARAQANDLELMALTPLAQYLADLFDTPQELPYVTQASEWTRLSSTEFWQHALLSESRRFNRELAKKPENDESKYNSRGVVHMQADKDINSPALTQLPLQHVHIYFPVCYLDVVLPKLAQPPFHMRTPPVAASSSNIVQSENYYFVLPEAQMPNTPVLNEMCETGLLHPETAYKVWFVNSCSLKLAVTMFTPTELECCRQNLAAHRLVVPDPAPTFSIARDVWPLTQAQLDMGTIAQQQASRQVNIDHIRDSGNVIRTDGCYCTTLRTNLAKRLQQGVLTGPPNRCQLYVPKAPIPLTQLNLILQQSPANRVANALQDFLRHSARRAQRPSTPPPTSRTAPTPKPYGYVPNSQMHRHPMGRPY